MFLELKRPLVCIDLETTGINIKHDRIVELAAVRIFPDGRQDKYVTRINPERPIPPEVTAIHGITDADVATAPTFAAIARDLLRFLAGCDITGFGILRFDLPLLTEEFRREGIEFSCSTVQVVDVQRIYHLREPRTLSAALRFYCDEEHTDAHGAEADVVATLKVLQGQLARYADLPRSVTELDDYCNPADEDSLDADNRLRWSGDEVVLAFGQKTGVPLRELASSDPAYLKWMLNKDFSTEVKTIVRDALQGKFPQRTRAAARKQRTIAAS